MPTALITSSVAGPPATPRLNRTTLRTSRLLDFCSRKELIAQTGHEPETWPLVVLKELLDNGLDACEDAGVAPEIAVTVDATGITVQDNGPGIPADTVDGVLDFAIRVSNREMYAAPDRGAQGNALKTLVAMPYVLDGRRGVIEIAAKGVRHRIAMEVDHIRQEPVIEHDRQPVMDVRNGTSIKVAWPDSACLILEFGQSAFFTNCRRLYLAQPAFDALGGLVRRCEPRCCHRREVAQVAAEQSDVPALVRQ